MRHGLLEASLAALVATMGSAILPGCQRASYFSPGMASSALSGAVSQLASGTGSGTPFDGGVARYIFLVPARPCSDLGADGKPLPNSEIDIIGAGGSRTALLVRDGCSNLAPPQILDLAEIQFATDGSGDLTYQNDLYVPAPMTAFYVSPSGSDANPGTLAAPLATPARAQQAMRSGSIKTTYLRAGTYAMSAPLTLASSDGGETWRYYPPDGVDSAVLDGGSSVDLVGLAASGVTLNGLKLQNFNAFGVYTTGSSRLDGITIENCDIGFNAVTSWSSGCIYLDNATHATYAGNYCHDVGSQGIVLMAYNPGDSIDGGVIQGNVVLRSVQRMSNGGSIYVGMKGGTQTSHVTVTGNYVKDYGGTGVSSVDGIDLEDGASYVTVTGNVVGPPAAASGTPAAFVVYDGHTDAISGNIVDLGASGTEWTAMWPGDSGATAGMAGNTFTGNLVISGFTGGQSTSSSGQSGYTYFEDYGSGSDYTIQDNVYYNYAGGQARTDGSLASDSSPVLEDPQISGWTYQIASGSPVFGSPVSFPPIPASWGPPGFAIPQSGTAPSAPH